LAAEKNTKTPILAFKKKTEALRFYATMAAISSNGLAFTSGGFPSHIPTSRGKPSC
jgi:hypothetical protein